MLEKGRQTLAWMDGVYIGKFFLFKNLPTFLKQSYLSKHGKGFYYFASSDERVWEWW
jgi:hypothetical protein